MTVLAKCQYLRKKKEFVFMDEFSFQALFMIFQKKADYQELREVLEKLPKSNHLFLFEGKDNWGHKAYKKKHPPHKGTLMPGSKIDQDYAQEWMKTMEHNFKIIKKIIKKDFIEDKKTFKELNLKYPKIFKRK